MGPIGVQEAIGIFIVALIIFGPKKLPELGRTVGKAITEFRRASSELKSTFESHLHELEKESDSIKQATADTSYSSNYSYPYESYDSYETGSPSSDEATSTHTPTGSETATQDAEQHRNEDHQQKPAVEQVAGTVARGGAIHRPSESDKTEETHSA